MNWGGTCAMRLPKWAEQSSTQSALETLSIRQRLDQLRTLGNSKQRPWLHLVDGGVSDNLGLRAILNLLDTLLQVLSVPIDHNWMDSVIIMQSMFERWRQKGEMR